MRWYQYHSKSRALAVGSRWSHSSRQPTSSTGLVPTTTTLLTQEYPAMLGLHNYYPPKEGEKAVEH